MTRTFDPDRHLPDPAARETEPEDECVGIAKTLHIDNKASLCTVIGDDDEIALDLSTTRLEEFEVDTLDELVRRYNVHDDMLAELKMLRAVFAKYALHHYLGGNEERAVANHAHADRIAAIIKKASPQ